MRRGRNTHGFWGGAFRITGWLRLGALSGGRRGQQSIASEFGGCTGGCEALDLGLVLIPGFFRTKTSEIKALSPRERPHAPSSALASAVRSKVARIFSLAIISLAVGKMT